MTFRSFCFLRARTSPPKKPRILTVTRHGRTTSTRLHGFPFSHWISVYFAISVIAIISVSWSLPTSYVSISVIIRSPALSIHIRETSHLDEFPR